jgi:hypothetical protein
MRVTNIDITDLHFSAAGDQHEGYVSMEVRNGRGGAPVLVQFLCHAAQPQDCPASIVTHDLIRDALRQARRMPGFRRGERKIELEFFEPRIASRAASA